MAAHKNTMEAVPRGDEYSRIAPVYDVVVGPFLRPVHEAMTAALGSGAVRPGDAVVDLCCGTGALADMAAGAGLRVVGVDLSPAMLHQARGRGNGVRYLLADAAATGLEPAGFAGCAISFALHEKPPEIGRAILAEALRLVRPGGLVVVADYRTANGARLAGAAIALVERLAGRDHHACYRHFMEKGGCSAFLTRFGLDPGNPLACFLGGRVGVYSVVV
ncbi:methyltransferase domain-containing protein [Pseudodesulfovibrio sp. F-1]|uniref:Methyltransferase domain-containing protein n=1 Tax=Pseudodesulfovibrio alkaliphilus TaxID=2661613 RepID=A0A7K1KR42_9BACT|nr:class I SAM-dependent methyltransferase [Pseudodesulfovibrio alkaliphilus]MUM78558.1 methyltransferase domain-containing protein [Pseudodesulfovibrio alkaliphilus]